MAIRVLLTNDDGPPNDLASPYVKYLVEAIHMYTDWKLTICVPSSQKSWIGKAHFAGRDLTASYVYSKIDEPEDNSSHGPFPSPNKKYSDDASLQEWCLVDGTPASCTDIGIHHISPEPVDLVISGPNVGRNSSAIYITSSGTVGAAMEGALMNTKAIGLSYAYDKTSATEPKILKEASLISIKIIDKLYKSWNKEADLYTVNIPLLDSLKLGETKMLMAPILENRWGTLFRSIASSSSDEENVSDIVDGSVSSGAKFKWSPDFATVHKNVSQTTELTDGKVISLGHISITAMKAVFKQADELNSGEFVLDDDDNLPNLQNLKVTSGQNNSIVISYPESMYIHDPIKRALDKFIPRESYKLYSNLESAPSSSKIFHYAEYEDLDHEKILSMGTGEIDNYMANSYTYRKGLIRKHYLANTIKIHTSKNPNSILKRAFPDTYQLQLDYAEFLDDSLDEEYDLRCELMENEENGCPKTYILKPSMSDKGQGIRIFKTIDQLQAVFDSFEEDGTDDEYDDDDEETMNDNEESLQRSNNNDTGIMTSQLRHFIVQEYIDRPLLLKEYENRKFHIRTYVLCKGSLEVFVYQRMLMLFSENEYRKPSTKEEAEEGEQGLDDDDLFDMTGHLTNTCLQEDTDKQIVVEFGKSVLEPKVKTQILASINSIVGELFSAATKVDKINFQPMKGSFEVFGLDFLVDEELNVSLLEVNSYPDFKQTGDDLKEMIYELFEGVVEECVVPYFEPNGSDVPKIKNLEKVLDISTNSW